ncbi:hypothetical protein RQP46_010844 [Phenoliferia psychrophenolica]
MPRSRAVAVSAVTGSAGPPSIALNYVPPPLQYYVGGGEHHEWRPGSDALEWSIGKRDECCWSVHLPDRSCSESPATGGPASVVAPSSAAPVVTPSSAAPVVPSNTPATVAPVPTTRTRGPSRRPSAAQSTANAGSPTAPSAVPARQSSGPRRYSKINLAYSANVTGSTENAVAGQRAVRAVDGIVGGIRLNGRGNPTAEWATLGEGAGATLTFTWASPVQIAKVTLADRPNLDDNIVAGTLHFSDGQFVNVPELPNDGTPLPLYFSPITTTSLVFVVTSVSEATRNIGLSEMGIFSLLNSPSASGIGPINWARYASASGHSAKYQGAAKAIDGVSVVPTTGFVPGDVYSQWNSSRGVGTTLRLTWAKPVHIASMSLFGSSAPQNLITGSTISFSTGTSVNVPALPMDGSALIINFPAVKVTSHTFTVTSVGPLSTAVGLEEIQAFTEPYFL